MGVTVDSTYLIDYMRGDRLARKKSEVLDQQGEPLFLSTPVIFEVVSGLLFSRSRLQASAFRALARLFTILPFDGAAAERAAEIRAELMRAGTPRSSVDIMIASIASIHGHRVVTRDSGFQVIAQVARLGIEAY